MTLATKFTLEDVEVWCPCWPMGEVRETKDQLFKKKRSATARELLKRLRHEIPERDTVWVMCQALGRASPGRVWWWALDCQEMQGVDASFARNMLIGKRNKTNKWEYSGGGDVDVLSPPQSHNALQRRTRFLLRRSMFNADRVRWDTYWAIRALQDVMQIALSDYQEWFDRLDYLLGVSYARAYREHFR